MRSAICSRNASPLPITPAGGVMHLTGVDRLFVGRALARRSMRLGKLASTMTVTFTGLYCSRYARTASSSCCKLGKARPSVARFDPSTTTCLTVIRSTSQSVARTAPGDVATDRAVCTARAPRRSRDARAENGARSRRHVTGDAMNEVVDLLQHLIRNACVNDGTEASGHEVRSADLLQTYLEGGGLDIERYEPAPGRTSLVDSHRRIGSRRANAVADGTHRRRARQRGRVATRSLRRRAHRRRGVGTRCGRHAQPHRVDGGGHQAPGARRVPARRARWCTWRWPTRRPSGPSAPTTS